MPAELSAVHFQDGVHAKGHLARLENRLAPSLLSPLASLLSESPDPDGALRQLAHFVENAPPDVLTQLELHPTALTYLVAVFSYSEALSETFLADPPLVLQFVQDRHFTKLKSVEDLMQDYARYSVTHPDLWLSSQLARFKRRNLLRIALKDVLHLSSLGETTLELSTLADVILKNALTYCDQELEKRYGRPQYKDHAGRIARSGFSIVSLGKLGGNELNYSSDIDLLFLYNGDGQTAGGSESSSVIPNKGYFVRLAEAINRTITQTTPHGEVYRVDLRGRPEGEEGDLAISVKSALEYYDHRARDWELQMLMKARHSAGDLRVTREFLHGVEPYVYRPPRRRANGEGLPGWGEQGSSQPLESRESALDVKFHPGGIRDIESFVQRLQRLHGGADSWVRSGGTLLALRKLNDKDLLADADFAYLSSAYEFLRKVEHRIQLKADRYAHRLPVGHAALNRLARRVGIETTSTSEVGASLVARLRQAFEKVNDICTRAMNAPRLLGAATEFQLSAATKEGAVAGADSLTSSLRLLDSRAPALANVVRTIDLAGRARTDARRLLSGLLGSSELFQSAKDHPQRIQRAFGILKASSHFSQLMIQHPESLAVLDLMDENALAHSDAQLALHLMGATPEPATKDPQAPAIIDACPPFIWAADSGLDSGEKLSLLRNEYRTRSLLLAARDVAGPGPIFDCLGRWAELALRCLATAFAMAWVSTVKNLDLAAGPLTVLACGRLGMGEFDLGERIELIFVVPADADHDQMDLALDLAKQTHQTLTSYTREGNVFTLSAPIQFAEREAEEVVSEDALKGFLSGRAGVRQLLPLAFLRPIAGNLNLGFEVTSRLLPVLAQRLESWPNVGHDVGRLFDGFNSEGSSSSLPSASFSCEIGLTLSILRLRHGVPHLAPRDFPTQISALQSSGYLSKADADAFTRSATILHTIDHACRLVTGCPWSHPKETSPGFEEIEALARSWGAIAKNASLLQEFTSVRKDLHATCRRLLALDAE